MYHSQVGRLVHRPALARPVVGVGDVEGREPPRLSNIRRHVLPFRPLRGVLPGRLEGPEGEYLDVQTVGIARRRHVRRVVDPRLGEPRADRIDQARVDKRAITGDAQDDVGAGDARRLVVPVQHVGFAAAIELVPE
jgi:hypothetical protein